MSLHRISLKRSKQPSSTIQQLVKALLFCLAQIPYSNDWPSVEIRRLPVAYFRVPNTPYSPTRKVQTKAWSKRSLIAL